MTARKIKIATIIGARPQFIKASVLSRTFPSVPNIEEILLHTGQHYDETMSKLFFEELQIPTPAYNLGLGSRRATAVKDYLASLGVPSSRITVVSKGKEQPFCAEQSESCWQQNRRGHFIVTAK